METTGRNGPIVFLQDWFTDAGKDWEFQIPFFQHHYHCLNVPLPGHPGSEGTEHPLRSLEEKLVQIITSLKEPVRIVAHGISCSVALRVIQRMPLRINSAVLISPFDSAVEHKRFVQRIGKRPWLLPIALAFRDPAGEQLGVFSRIRRRLGAFSITDAGEYCRELTRSDLMQNLKSINTRLLLITGDMDPWNSTAFAEKMNEELGRSQLIRYAHLGHNPHREESQLINRAVFDFFEESLSWLEKGMGTPRHLLGNFIKKPNQGFAID